jgi:hypothetical protein
MIVRINSDGCHRQNRSGSGGGRSEVVLVSYYLGKCDLGKCDALRDIHERCSPSGCSARSIQLLDPLTWPTSVRRLVG